MPPSSTFNRLFPVSRPPLAPVLTVATIRSPFELLKAIADTDHGSKALLHWYNTLLHTGTLPPHWLDSIMVLLPKVVHPKRARDTRPICMGCAAEKLFSRIILNRCELQLQLRKPWQCAGRHRQTTDFLHTIHRLFELEREWSKGISVLKIDFSKAFDTVNRKVLLERLFTKLGTLKSTGSGKRSS